MNKLAQRLPSRLADEAIKLSSCHLPFCQPTGAQRGLAPTSLQRSQRTEKGTKHPKEDTRASRRSSIATVTADWLQRSTGGCQPRGAKSAVVREGQEEEEVRVLYEAGVVV